MKFHVSVFLSLLIAVWDAGAQQPHDSLRRAAEVEKNTTVRIDLLTTLAEKTINVNPDTSFFYASKALSLAKKAGMEQAMVRAEYPIAMYHLRTGKPDSSFYFTSKNIPKIYNTKDQLLVNYLNLEGNYLMRANRQKEALERFYDALRAADVLKDPLSLLKAHNNIGFALMELNQFEKAIPEFKNAARLMELHNLLFYATVYNNIASCYGSLFQMDSAKKYVDLGIALANRNKDLAAEANGLNILGTLHITNKAYQSALDVFLKAKVIREKIGDPFFVVSDMATIADLYSKTGDYNKGIAISREALNIAGRNNITAKLPMIYRSMAANYEASGDFRSAADIYKKMNDLKDSIYADASPQALAEMQTKYETEKKESKIREQEYNLAQQQNSIRYKNTLLYGIIALSILAAALGYTQYRRYQWKQEAKMRTAFLKQQEEATRAVLEAEEAERQRIAKDLHDGVGQMMSAAKMNLSAFEDGHQFKTADDKQAFEKIISLVDDSCKEVRAVSHNMMPNALLKNSLAAAVREFIDKLDHRKLKVHLYTEGLEEKLDSNVETVLYRVIQECVNNVIRHSGADTVDITLIHEPEEITATIEDNGSGFDMADQEKFNGIGLRNIRTRVEYLRGTVDFDSAPGKGTLVAIHVPL